MFEVDKIINYDSVNDWKDDYPPFGFFDRKGRFYSFSYDNHWIGECNQHGKLLWTAGKQKTDRCDTHVYLDFENPHFITDIDDNQVLVSSSGNNKIFKINTNELWGEVFIDGEKYGLNEMGNCVFDGKNRLWVNEITGCRLHVFDQQGNHLFSIGEGIAGFNSKTVDFTNAKFNWIYDIRAGIDGNIYVLDSKNYAVRKVDIYNEKVITIAGDGKSGYTKSGELAIHSRFGSNGEEFFDGPWSLSVDEKLNLFIGDTQNHVVRMISSKISVITTIAGKQKVLKNHRNDPHIKDPLQLNLPKICSMDYFNGKLYIPEWDGDLIVLRRSSDNGSFK